MSIRTIGYGLAATFAVVGLLFLAIPSQVLQALNWVGGGAGFPASPVSGYGFYMMLAAAYMYVVTVLAVLMARHPRERAYPLVLVHAKTASSLLSLALFAVQGHYVIYLANFLVDGAIALLVFWLCLRRAAALSTGTSAA